MAPSRMRESTVLLYSVLVTPHPGSSECTQVGTDLSFGARQSCVRSPGLIIPGFIVFWLLKSLSHFCLQNGYKMLASQ